MSQNVPKCLKRLKMSHNVPKCPDSKHTQTRPDQTRPDQNRTEQTRTDKKFLRTFSGHSEFGSDFLGLVGNLIGMTKMSLNITYHIICIEALPVLKNSCDDGGGACIVEARPDPQRAAGLHPHSVDVIPCRMVNDQYAVGSPCLLGHPEGRPLHEV